MTVRQRMQQRGMPLSAGGWGGWMSDPAAIPPPSVYNQAIAGVIVNERTILSIMTVAACMRVIGDSISGLPVKVKRQQGNRKRFTDPEVELPQVIVEPFADIDREQGDFNCITSWGLNGNAYYHIIDHDKFGNPLQIEIVNPSQMRVNMIKGHRVYRIGSDTGPIIPNKDLVHVPWMTLAGGLVGLNPIEIGAVGFGLPIAANEYASRYFAQGMSPTGLLTIEKPIRADDKERIIGDLMTQHAGLAQSHTPIVLDSGAKWTQISVAPQAAQLLESREFSRSEICGFYGVPAHLIGDNAQANGYGQGLQEMVMGFVMFSLSGYCRRLDRMGSALLPAGYYVKREVKDLFKTNDAALGAYVSAMRMNAVATPNEIREYLGFPPSTEDGADSLWGPINSAHADFMIEGGGALSATPAAANQGAGNPTPLSPQAMPAGNTAPSAPGRSRLPLDGGVRAGSEDFQKDQGHGYHGYFESGKGPQYLVGGGDAGADPLAEGDSPVANTADKTGPNLADTSWSTSGKPMTATSWAQVLAQNPEGFTVDPRDGSSPKKGFQIGGVTAPLAPADPVAGGKAIAAFVTAHPELFTGKTPFTMGGYQMPDGSYSIETSENETDKFKAVYEGCARNQESIWDNEKAQAGDFAGAGVKTYGNGNFGEKNPYFDAPKLGTAIHPGYTATGEMLSKSSVATVNPFADMMSGLSPAAQKKVIAQMKKAGVTIEQATANFAKAIESATPQQLADGLTWYPRANALAEVIAHDTGISPDAAAGVIAATSRQTHWGSNVAGAQYIAKAVSDDMVINLPDAIIANAKKVNGVTITNGKKLSEQGDLATQARAVMLSISNDHVMVDTQYGVKKDKSAARCQLSCADDSVKAAIEIARGKDPDQVIGGHKQRSFKNNVADPNDPHYVTLDGWMNTVALGQQDYPQADDKAARALIDAPSSIPDNLKGCYPGLADAMRAAAAQVAQAHGIPLLPDQAQAVAWVATMETSKPDVTATPTTPVQRPDSTLFTPLQSGKTATSDSHNTAIKAHQQAPNAMTTIADTARLAEQAKAKPVVLRAMVPQAEALKAAIAQYGADPAETPAAALFGVKCANGKIALAMMDYEMLSLQGEDPATVKAWGFTPLKTLDIQTAVSTAADLYDADHLGLSGPPILVLRGPAGVIEDNPKVSPGDEAGILAYTNPGGPNQIRINGSQLSKPKDPDTGWSMPIEAAPSITQAQYTVTHEFGHLTEFAHDLYPADSTAEEKVSILKGKWLIGSPMVKSAFVHANRVSATLSANDPNGLSEYGKTNAHEAYAEAFTEFKLTGGETSSKVAQAYNKVFHWDKPEKLAEGANESSLYAGLLAPSDMATTSL